MPIISPIETTRRARSMAGVKRLPGELIRESKLKLNLEI
jgi:hypothetical protein